MYPQTSKYKGVNVDFHIDMYNHWLVNQQRKNRKKVFLLCINVMLEAYVL